MKKKVNISGKVYTMKASALMPRIYRFHFGRDLVADMNNLSKSYAKAVETLNNDATEEEKRDAQLSVTDLTVFENVAWIMLKLGGEEVGENPEEWLDGLDGVFSVYEALPIILEMWGTSQQTTSVPKKK